MRYGAQYLPGVVLLLIGGILMWTQVSSPSRFEAGRDTESAAALERELQRLRDRVAGLEAELAVLRSNAVLDLDGHVTLIPRGDGVATLRFSGVDLQVVNRRGVALDTAADPSGQ